MGMFDYVNYKCVCPACKDDVEDFQTKDRNCVLDIIEPKDVSNFYSLCLSCGAWIELNNIGKNTYSLTVERHNSGKVIHNKTVVIK